MVTKDDLNMNNGFACNDCMQLIKDLLEENKNLRWLLEYEEKSAQVLRKSIVRIVNMSMDEMIEEEVEG